MNKNATSGVARVVIKAKKILGKVKTFLFPGQFDKTIQKWFDNDGDNTLKQEFDLNSDSFVMDVGGYCGQWASDIFSRYSCNVAVFEPVKHFAENIKKRFAFNPRIKVYDFGLSGKTEAAKIFVAADSSSVFRGTDAGSSILLKDIVEWLDQESIRSVNLIKINIEGGEFDLLERLLDADKTSLFDTFLVQFHRLNSDSEQRMRSIQNRLQKTHRLVWQYQFVWECWKKV